MAMVQSCTAEFMSMQTVIDRENIKVRSHLQEELDKIYNVGPFLNSTISNLSKEENL